MAPKPAQPPTESRIINAAIFVFFVAGAIATVGTAIDSEGGHAVVNKLRAVSGADERVITATVDADSIELHQNGPDSLKNCRVTVNQEFVYQAGSIAPQFYATLPLREFALPDGLRFDTRRYKVNSVKLDCDGISRSVEPQR